MGINNINFKKNCGTCGATLLETVIYTTLLSLLTAVTIVGLLTLNNSLQGIILGRIVDDTAQESIEKIVREVRFADSVDTLTSSLSVNPSVLILNSRDDMGTPVTVEFSISGGTLEFKRDGVLVGPLTPNVVTIDELIFDFIVTPESEAIKISLVLQAQRSTVSVEETFSTTVLLRGSY